MQNKLKENSICFILPPEDKRVLRIMAAEAEKSISEYLRDLIHEQVKDRLEAAEPKSGKLRRD